MNRCYTFVVFAFFAGSMSLCAQQGTQSPAVDPTLHPPSMVATPGDTSLPAQASANLAQANLAQANLAQANLAQVTSDYVMGDQDVIQVTVWREPTLSGNLVVRPDGMVSVPLLGDVKAAGLTPMALGKNLSERLTQYIKDPLVTVTVVAVNSTKIYLIGEIARPGPLVLSPGMTLLQAISSAGGLTPYANEKHIYILRGTTGKQKKIPFNYKKAVNKGDQQGINLAAGDTIVIP